MGLFGRKRLLSKDVQQKVKDAIQKTEHKTSGEVRVFVESHCKYIDALERATEVFFGLKMDQTQLSNAVLVYVALKDKQSAILGDRGVFEKVTQSKGPSYWKEVVKEMNALLKEGKIAEGLTHAVSRIGNLLSEHFPYNPNVDKNELPDNIAFGK